MHAYLVGRHIMLQALIIYKPREVVAGESCSSVAEHLARKAKGPGFNSW